MKRDECRIRGTDGEMEMSPLNGPDLIYPGGRESLAGERECSLAADREFRGCG